MFNSQGGTENAAEMETEREREMVRERQGGSWRESGRDEGEGETRPHMPVLTCVLNSGAFN